MRQKGQSSVEYMFVVALALLIIIPGSMIFYSYSNTSQGSLLNSQIFKIGNTMIDTGVKIYSIGDNSWQTIDISLPEHIDSVKVYNSGTYSELVIEYGMQLKTEGVFFTQITLCNETNCSCENGCSIPFHDGVNELRIASEDGKIYYKVVK